MHGVSTKRGGPATDALGILPGLGGTSVQAAARAAFVRRDAELVQEGLAAPRRSAPPGRADAASSARQCHHHFDLAGAAGQQLLIGPLHAVEWDLGGDESAERAGVPA